MGNKKIPTYAQASALYAAVVAVVVLAFAFNMKPLFLPMDTECTSNGRADSSNWVHPHGEI